MSEIAEQYGNPSGMSEGKQMTAVEWLVEMVSKMGYVSTDIFEQAKEMERQQHEDTWLDSRTSDYGDDYVGKKKTFEQYFNETYGKP